MPAFFPQGGSPKDKPSKLSLTSMPLVSLLLPPVLSQRLQPRSARSALLDLVAQLSAEAASSIKAEPTDEAGHTGGAYAAHHSDDISTDEAEDTEMADGNGSGSRASKRRRGPSRLAMATYADAGAAAAAMGSPMSAAAAAGGGSGLLPPLAPVSRGQQLPSARQPGVSASQGGRALTDDEQQHLAGLTSSRGANSFDPVSSPAGKISPVGTAVTTLGGSGHVPEPALLHRYGLGGTASGSGSDAGSGSGGMGLSSPRSYPQLQQAHPSLLPYAAHSQGVVGGAPLLSSFPDGSATQTAAAISSMAGSGEPFWLLQQAAALDQQQQQLAGRSTSGLLSSSGMLQLGGGASVFSSMPQPALAGPDALQLQYEQQLLQLQQQYQQQVEFAAGADHLPGAGLLPTALSSAPHAPPVNAVRGAAQGPLGGVGALSGSFAFGAPYSSSFSPAPMRGSSSLGGVPAGDAGDGLTGREGGGGGGSVSRPELLLPDDLNFSPPSSGPARWLE